MLIIIFFFLLYRINIYSLTKNADIKIYKIKLNLFYERDINIIIIMNNIITLL